MEEKFLKRLSNTVLFHNAMLSTKLLSHLVFLFMVVLCAGCNHQEGRLRVSGNVTFDGQPLPNGRILFLATNTGQSASSKIQAGAYNLSNDLGLLPGKYRIEIKAMRDVGQAYIDSESGEETRDREQYIPATYNAQSKLTIEVTLDGENKFDFALSKSGD